MPAIKLKKAAAEHQAEKEREERERESETTTNVTPKPKEAHPGGGLLRGLDTNILFEKRKRVMPPSEQKLLDWMESNLEAKEDCHVNLNSLYDYFGEACTFDGTAVLDQLLFNKRIAEKFGKAFALKDSSPYKGIIKEKKAAADKQKGAKADYLKHKMKDIIEEAIKDAGNPEKGVRFVALKQYIACNYPILRVDLRPGYLKAALERGVRFGHIHLVKGVGLSGYFRLPVDVEPDETEDKPADKEGAEASAEGATAEHQNGDAEGAEDKPKDEAAADEAKPKKKSRKRKSAETGEGEEGEKGETAEGEEGKEEEKKKKKKSKKHRRRRPRFDSIHSAPQKIEDTFALAMTYMCEPKQTSFGKIRKYIIQHYPHVDVDAELKSKMESGEKKGYWEHVTGQGLAGSFRLMIDEFDPNSTDNIEDMICSAIIACNEPKQSSANLLKKYVMEYHPEFKIDARPHLFKNALERALKKQMIIQLSGIGATGSFQMWSVFSPSPALLAGEDQSDDEDYFVDSFKEEAYVPRGTKSRKLIKKSVTETPVESRPKPKKRSHSSARSESSDKGGTASKSRPRPKSAQSSSRSRGRVNYAEDDEGEEEREDEEEDEPAPKRARKAAKSSKGSKGKKPKYPKKKAKPKKKDQRPVSRSQLAEEDEEEKEDTKSKKAKKSKPTSEEEEEEEPVTPVKEETKSKKAKKSKPTVDEDEEEPTTPVKGSRGRSRARPNYAEEKGGDDDDDDDEEEKSSKGRKSSGSRRASKTTSYSEKEDEEGDEEEDKAEYTPRKSKSRGGEEEEETSTSPKKKGRKRR